MKAARTVLILSVALLTSYPLSAAEKKAAPCPATQYVAKLTEGLTLTDDQNAKLDELKKEYGPKLTEAKDKLDVLTPEQKKVQTEAKKAAKQAGKKGKEYAEAVASSVVLGTEQQAQQAENMKQRYALMRKLNEKVTAVLTIEQIEQLKKKRAEATKNTAK